MAYSALGNVYFIRNENNGLIKIGFSAHVERRLISLQQAEKTPLTLLAAVPALHSVEGRIHQILKPLRHHGEWYSPSPFLDCCIRYAQARPWGAQSPHFYSDPLFRRHWLLERITEPAAIRLLVEDAIAFGSTDATPASEPPMATQIDTDAAAYWGEWVGLL